MVYKRPVSRTVQPSGRRECARPIGWARRRAPWHGARAGAVAALAVCAVLGAGFCLDGPRQLDLSDRTWTGAFAGLCARLRREYPFTAWKGLDWAAMEGELAPAVERAEATGDRRAFYLALRRLVWQMRDGHARLAGDDGGLRERAISGWFGLELVELDDPAAGGGAARAGVDAGGSSTAAGLWGRHHRRVLAGVVAPDGAAARAGVRFGAAIERWNGAAIDEALETVPVLWTERPPATAEGLRLAQDHMIGRAPVGARVRVTFRNLGAAAAETRELLAEPAPADPSPCLSAGALLWRRTVATRTLASGVGYVKLRFELPTLRQLRPQRDLARALGGFAAAGLPGVIVDVRDNCGGADAMVPPLVAPLLDQPLFYEQPGIFQPSSDEFAPDPRQAVTLTPRPPLYHGRIAVLIDSTTVSAGEAIPYLLKGLPGTEVIGWHATQGSFGIGEKSVVLPAGLRVFFPHAQSLDRAGTIEVDGDAAGHGGVEPDRRLRLDEESFQRWLGHGEDLPLEEAVRFVRGGG